MDIPEKFSEVIRDFLADLSVTFPEYVYLWEVWQQSDTDITPLYQYCMTIYPERFFDILYQNEDIFQPESESNTLFIPNVEFKMLYSAPGISENTKQALWKYLQLVLITIMGNIQTSASFGDTAGLFEGIKEEELQKKLGETIEGLTDFFKGLSKDGTTEGMEKAFENIFTSTKEEGESSQDTMPNADDLHDHLKSLFDGKIGILAKELAEEMSGEMMDMFDDGTGEPTDTNDILKKMMRNPKKIMEMVKKIGSKLDDKMKSGSISQEELMKEASDMMSKMGGMGNGKEFQEMMKNMMKSMGGKGGGMGAGKGMFDMNKMNTMMGNQKQKERMRTKLEQRKAATQATSIGQTNYTLEAKSENEFVFKVPEEGVQEKSKAPINDDWLDEIKPDVQPKSNGGGGKKKKGKKGK